MHGAAVRKPLKSVNRGMPRDRSAIRPSSCQRRKLTWKSQLHRRFCVNTKLDFPPCQPSLPGHGTVCKTGDCKTNIFFHCPSQPRGPSGRPALQAKLFYFQHPQLPFNNQKFSTFIKETRERPREQLFSAALGR